MLLDPLVRFLAFRTLDLMDSRVRGNDNWRLRLCSLVRFLAFGTLDLMDSRVRGNDDWRLRLCSLMRFLAWLAFMRLLASACSRAQSFIILVDDFLYLTLCFELN